MTRVMEQTDLLTPEEEELLSTLRRIVSGIRAHHASLAFATIVAAVLAAGAKQEESAVDPGARTFSKGGVRFTLRSPAGRPWDVEVSFAPRQS